MLTMCSHPFCNHSIPSVLVPLILVGAVASRFFGSAKKGSYTGKYDPKTGLGRGAPGFRKAIRPDGMPLPITALIDVQTWFFVGRHASETGVKRMAVTPEIAARMRAGEQVSAEEIEAAVAKAQSQGQASSTAIRNPNVDQDWLPQGGRSPTSKKNKRK